MSDLHTTLDQVKRCTRCGETKPLDQFRQRKDRPNPSSHCKACHAATSTAAQAKKPEMYAAMYAAIRAKRIAKAKRTAQAHRVVAASTSKQRMRHLTDLNKLNPQGYRVRGPVQVPMFVERVCAQCQVPIMHKRRQGKYLCGACGRANAQAQRRSTRQLPQNRAWSNLRKRVRDLRRPDMVVWARALADRWAYYGGLCWMCGEVADTWDHVKPMSKGGHATMPCNLRPACRRCNCEIKRDRWAA